jgi:hypothetical protein
VLIKFIQSTISFVVIICCFCTFEDGGDVFGGIWAFINLLLSIALVIWLSIDPLSKADIQAGKADYNEDAQTAHLYYGMFVTDLFMM